MKLIALEEHLVTPAVRAAWERSAAGSEGVGGFDRGEIGERLLDLGEQRMALMDESGVDVQVLSLTTPALHNLEPAESVTLARETNDRMAAAVAAHPTRFQGFATLPMPSPADAARELERGVQQLGMMGAMLCGRTRDKNLDHPDYRPLFASAAALRAPLYIHPQVPQRAVREALYGGLGEDASRALSAFGLGWHYEAGIQFVRLIVAGVFDEFPDVQIVLGHWGEVVLFYLERLQGMARVVKLRRPVEVCMRENLYVTPSGMWSDEYLRRCVEIVGPERLMFSLDYPYQYKPGGAGRSFVENCALSEADKERFAHGNWERLTAAIRREF